MGNKRFIIGTGNIKPCPFCGSHNLLFATNKNTGHGDATHSDSRVICDDCDATKGQGGWGDPNDDTLTLAIEAWNKRQ